MLSVHRSERSDPLVHALGELLAAPSGDPFAAEIVAVPSRGVERWLAQQLSHVLGAQDGDGVCANVVFPAASGLLDDAVSAAHPAYAASVLAWAPERAVWPLVRLIDDSVGAPWAGTLAVHLGLDAGTDLGRRFAVASKLARSFGSYGRSRPGMVRAWRDGRDEQGDGTALPTDLVWQAQLWRLLREQLGPAPAELIDAACSALQTGSVAASELPARLSVFGVTRLSPSRIQVLAAVAETREVHLWLNHPSPALWDAIAASGAPSGRRRDDDAALVIANPLLASLSRDVRELQQLLPREVLDQHHAVVSRPNTVLGRLQADLASDTVAPTPVPAAPDDRSLTVHACHGPARQMEVVREVVLGLLAGDPSLEPRDILIMCPDVEAYAPLVVAAFGMAEDGGSHPAARLRVRLADRSLRQTNPLLGLLGQLLALAGSRVSATQLLDLAGAAAVRARFGFSDDDLEQLREWASATNARWGLDADYRTPYGLGGLAQGTWRLALDRLLLGVAMPDGEQWLGDVLASDDVDSGDIDLAGKFAEFVDRADIAVRALQQTRTVIEWTHLLSELVLSLGAPSQPWQGAQLLGELADIADAATESDVPLARADITALLAGRLAGRPTRAGFRTGTLTVCSLVPMRSVPHRVVCLVGMDDGSFPRHGVVDGDDVLARDPRVGERDVRSEDRQLFLDAICAAREHLVITYTGADPRTGAHVPPCVPLGELLDAVDASAQAPDGSPGRTHVLVQHPLQPFDARNFTAGALGSDGPFSFDPSAFAGARAAASERTSARPLVAGSLPPATPQPTVALEDLVRFLQHPARAFLRQRLEISTWEDDRDLDDALAVELDGLLRWAVGDRVLRARLSGTPVATCKQLEERRGDLPPGELGRRALNEIGRTVESLLRACEAERSLAPESVEVSVPVGRTQLGTAADGAAQAGERRLVGTVGGVRGQAILSVTYSSLGAKQRLEAWVKYLAVVATTGRDTYQAVSVGRGSDGVRRSVLRGIDPADAQGLLTELVQLRELGLREPLPVALKTSEAYAVARRRGRDTATAVKAALPKWTNTNFPGEDCDREHRMVWGEAATLPQLMAAAATTGEQLPDETTRFGALARRLWTPLLDAEIDVTT